MLFYGSLELFLPAQLKCCTLWPTSIHKSTFAQPLLTTILLISTISITFKMSS
jgi:hypothetical protein